MTFSIQSPRIHLQANTCVSDLIDQDTRGWNGPLIAANFTMEEAEMIQKIPLSPLQPRDRLVWRCTPNGVFSVAVHTTWKLRGSHDCGGKSQTLEKSRKLGRCVGNSRSLMQLKCSCGEGATTFSPQKRI